VNVIVGQLGGGHLLDTPFWRAEADRAEIVEPIYRQHIKRLPPRDPVDTLALCMPLWPMRVVRRVVWSDSCLVGLEPGRRPFSHAMFRHAVLMDVRYVLGLFDHLKAIGVNTIAVSGPGLFRDNSALWKMNPNSVLRLFQLYRELVMEELKARSIPIVDIPSECLDDDGFMQSEYRSSTQGDHHHANAAFGEMMILAIERCVLKNRPRLTM
jgi:hypothetical protein